MHKSVDNDDHDQHIVINSIFREVDSILEH